MPAKKNAFVTLPVIYAIRRKEMWMPKQAQITQVVQRAKPPPIKQLVAHIAEAIERLLPHHDAQSDPTASALSAFKERILLRHPDSRFLLHVLKFLDGDHAIFAKDFAYYR